MDIPCYNRILLDNNNNALSQLIIATLKFACLNNLHLLIEKEKKF